MSDPEATAVACPLCNMDGVVSHEAAVAHELALLGPAERFILLTLTSGETVLARNVISPSAESFLFHIPPGYNVDTVLIERIEGGTTSG